MYKVSCIKELPKIGETQELDNIPDIIKNNPDYFKVEEIKEKSLRDYYEETFERIKNDTDKDNNTCNLLAYYGADSIDAFLSGNLHKTTLRFLAIEVLQTIANEFNTMEPTNESKSGYISYDIYSHNYNTSHSPFLYGLPPLKSKELVRKSVKIMGTTLDYIFKY